MGQDYDEINKQKLLASLRTSLSYCVGEQQDQGSTGTSQHTYTADEFHSCKQNLELLARSVDAVRQAPVTVFNPALRPVLLPLRKILKKLLVPLFEVQRSYNELNLLILQGILVSLAEEKLNVSKLQNDSVNQLQSQVEKFDDKYARVLASFRSMIRENQQQLDLVAGQHTDDKSP